MAVVQIRATPPMLPPTMAPIGVELELEAGADVDEVVGALVVEVELDSLGKGEVRDDVEDVGVDVDVDETPGGNCVPVLMPIDPE